MKGIIVILFGFILANPLMAQEVMTVDDAVRAGLRNNYSIRIARNTETITQRDVGKGRAGYLPKIDLINNMQLNRTNQSTNSPFSFGNSDTRSFGTQVSMNWTLFDGFRMFIDKNRLEILSTLGTYRTRDTIERTVVDISTAYFNLVQQEQLLNVLRIARDVSETRYNQERIRNELGGASSTDLFNAQVSLNNDQASVLIQELEVSIAAKELNLLLARDPDTPVTVTREIPIPSLEDGYEELRRLALERNSALRVARQNKMVGEKNVRMSKASFYPVLSLNTSYGYSDRRVSSSSPQFGQPITTRSRDGLIGVTLSYNIFNGTRDRIDLDNARAEAFNRELALKDSELILQGLVREKYETFRKRMELITLEEQNVVAAQRNLQLQQERYQIGATTSLEFRDAQVNLIRVQATLINVRFRARITRLEIEQLTGNVAVE